MNPKKNQSENLHQQLEKEIQKRKFAEQQLQHAEAEVRRLKHQLQEATQHKNEFLSSMSHELRTPLNAMIGYTSLTLNALRDKMKPEIFENLGKAECSARHLLQLINDILDFSKIESGEMEIFLEELELVDLLEEVIINVEGQLHEKTIALEEGIASDLPIVKSDYAKIKQILDNLLSNAIKFTSEGYIAVRAKSVNNNSVVRIEVEDSGVGIPEDKIDSIFELFKQVDGSIKKKFAGTGLGLAITKSFCDMLHIEIGVESTIGKGTLFWLHIPVQVDSDQEPGSTTRKTQSSQFQESTDAVSEGTRAFDSVLVVDDDEMNLSLHREIFERAEYTVHLAKSGSQCLEIVKQVMPDLILMDLGMPEMDGFETTQRLKQDPVTSEITIIACSAFTTRELQEKASQVGCEGYITKPIEPQRLIAQVTQVVQKAKQKS